MATDAQPQWRFLANLGDASPIDYGGAFVFTDETGVYPPEMEVLINKETAEDDNGPWTVYRFILDKCTYIDGILSDNKFHPDFPVWYADELEAVASYIGSTADAIRADLCSDDIHDRARAYQALYEYHGLDNFDSYPLTFTDRAEVEARYADCNI